MSEHDRFFEANQRAWNERTKLHIGSKFYDVEGFVQGRNSLSASEQDMLGDVVGKDLLHLQCHFGQDTLSLARMGARVTGLDISDEATRAAQALADRCGLHAEWVTSNVLHHQPQLDDRFDVVFTSYGTIGWIPELRSWANNIFRYLRPGGRFVIVEFHPVVWMFDNTFERIAYSYFNRQLIEEEEQGSYADRHASVKLTSYSWNHDLAEVHTALRDAGLHIDRFVELDGSPHDCFSNTVKGDDGLFRIQGLEGKIPMVYAIVATKPHEVHPHHAVQQVPA